ncbi:MAG: SDR family oxidoreductase [Planctomycetota bacterium]
MAPAPVALVTGGNRGIGLAIARALAARGLPLALVARDEAQLRSAAQQLGSSTTCLALDLASSGAAERVSAWLQGRSIEVLVNNAGTAPSERFEATTDEVLRHVLALHVQTPFALARLALAGMKARGRGTIVQVASTAGLRGFPFTAAYCAAKHGLLGWTRALISELGDSPLRVYAVCPGFVDTELTRGAAARVAARGKQTADEALAKMGQLNVLGRLHSVGEIAAFVAQLCVDRPPSGVFDLDREPPTRVE